MSEPLFTIDHSRDETHEIVHMGVDSVIFDGGWWMKRSDYDLMWRLPNPPWIRRYPRRDIGIDRDKETRQLKIFFIPTP